MKDIICPGCGRLNIFSPLKNDSCHISLPEEDIFNINFNAHSNNFDLKNNNNSNEKKITNYNSTYSIDNFNFSINNEKHVINNNKNANEETQNYYKKAKAQKKLGRKTKNSEDSTIKNGNNIDYNHIEKIHDRFTGDNIRAKCKNLILKCLLEFINNKIKIEFNNEIGHGNSERKLKILAKKKTTVNLEREFMNKTLKDIFSQNISSRICNYSLDHNKRVIESLINEKEEIKRNYFRKLFNLTFNDCLKNFRGEKKLEELEGFKSLASVKNQLLKENGIEYVNHFVYFIKNFEKMLK